MALPIRNAHLPPHIREVCDILARGIVRLRSRAAAENARAAGDNGETPLHFTAHPSGHANRTNRRDA